MTAYVYYSYEEFGRGYIGARSKSPDGDDYFGSFKDTTFKPTNKIILAEFDSMEEAIEVEVALHNYFDVAVNPHFANRAKQTSTGWTTYGTVQTEEWKEKAMRSLRTPEVEEKRLRRSNKTNKERLTNSYFNPELREIAQEKAVETNRENKTGCAFDPEYQIQRRINNGWTKELWEDIEKGLSTGKRYWGLYDIAEKYGVSRKTVLNIKSHIENKRTWEDVMDCSDTERS